LTTYVTPKARNTNTVKTSIPMKHINNIRRNTKEEANKTINIPSKHLRGKKGMR
jgi:hypothetical protein